MVPRSRTTANADRIPAFAALASNAFGTAVTGETGAADREPVAQVSPDFFAALGSRPAMGRSFTARHSRNRTVKAFPIT
jgi:hypothetical protein